MISIHNNFESVRLSRHISNRLGSLKMTYGRISTGLRVNRSGDDAAGLQISTRLTKQIIDAQAEIKNITDETSLLQVANGALGESLDALHRMRELAVSAANETLSLEDRTALQAEFKALMTHIDEISENTTFNGKKILTSEATQLRLSLMGDDDSADNALSTALLPTMNTHTLGTQARYESARRGVFVSPIETGDLVINGVKVRGTTRYDDSLSYSYASGSALAKAKAINAVSAYTGVKAIVDDNVIEGREAIQEIELDESHWLKINGVYFSGFKIEANDASGELRKHLNAAFSQTGVKTSVTQEGHLLLSAEDGRNITVEYGDGDVRDALRIVDLFGDPVNLSDTVEPAEYTYDGDAELISSDVSAAGFSAVFKGDPEIPGDTSGQYGGHRDLVDYIIEVVDPGPLGTATYRIKQEDASFVAVGTKDTDDSDHLFNAPGVIQQHDPSKLTNLTSVYNSASTRELRIEVKTEGNPYATTETDRPLVDLVLYNTSSGIEEERVERYISISDGPINDFLADYGVSFQPLQSDVKGYSNANGYRSVNHQLNLEQVSVGSGHDYSPSPKPVFVGRWDNGWLTVKFDVEVIGAGHAIGTNDPADTAEVPAKIKVTANVFRDGSETVTSQEVRTFSLNSSSDRYDVDFSTLDPGIGQISLFFPQPLSQLQAGVSTPDWTSSSGYDLPPQLDNQYYVGPDFREYLVHFTSDGVFTPASGDGPSADLYANGVYVDTITEVNSDYFKLLGPTGDFEGLQLKMAPPKITSQTRYIQMAGGAAPSNHFTIGSYAGENRRVVVEITEGGDTSGSDLAKFTYYDRDTGEVFDGGEAKFSTSLGGLVLSDGLKITLNADSGNNVSQITAQSDGALNYLQRVSSSGSYDRGKIGEMTATLSGTTTTIPFSHDVLQGGQVTYTLLDDVETPQSFTAGGGLSTSDITSVTGSYVSGGDYASTQDFYLFFKDGVAHLSTGSNGDVIANTALTDSSGIDGSNTFTINGSSVTINYNLSAVDDVIDLDASDETISAVKIRLIEEEVVEDYDLNVHWDFEGGTHDDFTIEDIQDKIDQDLDLGYGVKGRFRGAAVASTPLADGAQFTLTATPRNLKKGDKIFATLEAMVHSGDQLKVTAQPQDLAVGTTWTFTTNPPTWYEGDVYSITYNHNFEPTEYTLSPELSYSGSDSMGTLLLNATGDFKTGDQIHVKTRSYLGGVESSGLYTETLYPTDYILTVVQGGDISDPAISGGTGGDDTVTINWVREDGLTESFLDGGGEGSFTINRSDLEQEIALEEGVYVTFKDLGQGAYLATGDQITIPVGRKLFYTFSGGISLQSKENIDLQYSSEEVDNLMGRMMFQGPDELINSQLGEEFSLGQGLLGKSAQHSIASTGLLTQRQINEAIDTIDVAIEQLGESMTKISALSQRAVHRIESLNQKALDLMMVRSRIQDADMAVETAQMASEQIRLMSAPLLGEIAQGEALTVLDLIRDNAR